MLFFRLVFPVPGVFCARAAPPTFSDTVQFVTFVTLFTSLRIAVPEDGLWLPLNVVLVMVAVVPALKIAAEPSAVLPEIVVFVSVSTLPGTFWMAEPDAPA